MTTTWKEQIEIEMEFYGESLSDIVSSTISEDEMNKEFDNQDGYNNGTPFTVRTANRIYFPAGYDGAEWCVSVSRNQGGKPISHIGGG